MSETLPVAVPKKRGRKPWISAPVVRAIELLVTGECKTIKAAAKAAGISRENLSKALQRPHVDEYRVKRIHQAQRVHALRAAHRMGELLDSDNAMVSYRSAEHLLATGAGVVKPSEGRGATVNIGVTMQAGFVLDLRPDAAVPVPATEVAKLSVAGGTVGLPCPSPPRVIDGEVIDADAFAETVAKDVDREARAEYVRARARGEC